MEEHKPKPWRKYVWLLVLYILAGAITLPLFFDLQLEKVAPAPIETSPTPTEENPDTGEPKLTIGCENRDALTAYESGTLTCQIKVTKNEPVVGSTTGEVTIAIGGLSESNPMPYLHGGSGTLGGNTEKLENNELKLTTQIRSLPAEFILGFRPSSTSPKAAIQITADLKTEEYDLQGELNIPYADKAPEVADGYQQTKGDFYYEVKTSRETLSSRTVFDYELTVESHHTADGSLNTDPFQTVLVTLYPTDVQAFENKYSRPSPPMNHAVVMVNGKYQSISTDGTPLVPQTPFIEYLFQYASTFTDQAKSSTTSVSEGNTGISPYSDGDNPNKDNGLKDGQPYYPSTHPLQRIRLVLENGVGKIQIAYDGTKSLGAKNQVISVVPISYCQIFGNLACGYSKTEIPRRPEDYLFLYGKWFKHESYTRPAALGPSDLSLMWDLWPARTDLAIPIV
jgi:hypothetical protein